MSKRGTGARWDIDQLLDHLKNNPSVSLAKAERMIREATPTSAAAQALRSLADETDTQSKGTRLKALKKEARSGDGVALGVLIDSVKTARVRVQATWFPDGTAQELVLWFEGARIMTLNRMISLLTNPKSAVKGPYFSYKKKWKDRMDDAGQLLLATYGHMPSFIHPVTVEVMRHAPRLADRDALAFMFKIHIDALRGKNMKIIRDDNPNEVVDVIPYQKQVNPLKGVLGVGLRLVAQPLWTPPPVPDVYTDWFRSAGD